MESATPTCVVVVPLYRVELDPWEVRALRTALDRLSGTAFVFLTKQSIHPRDLLDRLDLDPSSRIGIHPITAHLGADTPDMGVGTGGLSLWSVADRLRILESPSFGRRPVFRGRELAPRVKLFSQ